MNTYQNPAQINTDKEISDASGERKSSISNFGITDNRPEVLAQRKLTAVSQDTDQSKQIKQLQESDGANSVTQDSIQKLKNNTGLPDNLKSGVESMSGYSLDDVKVHYNSDKPAQLQAHAYAQGTDIHIAPGQEKHLPHETWHVVQQKQGRVKPTMQLKGQTPVNDDAGLEKEADEMGARALVTGSTTQLKSLNRTVINSGSAQPVQRAIEEAEVTWGITHVVKEQGGSIYGTGNPDDEEFDPLEELIQGQKIIINDDDIFVSRRGANQEEKENRDEREDARPSIPWVRVHAIKNVENGGWENVTSRNVYVRAETVKIVPKVETEKSKGPFKKVDITEINGWSMEMDLALHKIETEWLLLGGNPNKDKGEKECSGDEWNQADEGADVANELTDPDNRTNRGEPHLDMPKYQRTFIAHYEGERDPIAVMMVEMRFEDFTQKDLKHLYIRWLVGSPTRQGGGSKLVGKAKQLALQVAGGKLRVESARSAEEWYRNKQGFVTKYNSKHEEDVYDGTTQEEFDELEDCGCKFMAWDGEL